MDVKKSDCAQVLDRPSRRASTDTSRAGIAWMRPSLGSSRCGDVPLRASVRHADARGAHATSRETARRTRGRHELSQRRPATSGSRPASSTSRLARASGCVAESRSRLAGSRSRPRRVRSRPAAREKPSYGIEGPPLRAAGASSACGDSSRNEECRSLRGTAPPLPTGSRLVRDARRSRAPRACTDRLAERACAVAGCSAESVGASRKSGPPCLRRVGPSSSDARRSPVLRGRASCIRAGASQARICAQRVAVSEPRSATTAPRPRGAVRQARGSLPPRGRAPHVRSDGRSPRMRVANDR